MIVKRNLWLLKTTSGYQLKKGDKLYAATDYQGWIGANQIVLPLKLEDCIRIAPDLNVIDAGVRVIVNCHEKSIASIGFSMRPVPSNLEVDSEGFVKLNTADNE